MKILKTTIWTAVGLFGLAALVAMPAAADQVILDDLIVDGSACIGQDCVNGESFGFDTIRIKENNLRIKAQDTSSTASFPTQDWQITFNDSTNGGQNKFSIDAISPSTGTPLTIEAGAPSHSLYVDDGGRLGFGTSTPVADLHVKSGNTPTLRLEQDGSSGFAAQTWDLAGNEANFFIRDATNGSTLPFRIFPAAPSNALVIEGSTGDIGIGTTSPSTDLHVRSASTTDEAIITVETAQAARRARVSYVHPNQTWNTTNVGSDFTIVDASDGGVIEFRLAPNGNLTVSGDLFSNTCTNPGSPCAPDYVFEPDYELMPLDELRSFVDSNKHLPNVPTAEELAGPVNVSDLQMTLLEKIEELTLYTLAQQETIDELRIRLSAMEEQDQ